MLTNVQTEDINDALTNLFEATLARNAMLTKSHRHSSGLDYITTTASHDPNHLQAVCVQRLMNYSRLATEFVLFLCRKV